MRKFLLWTISLTAIGYLFYRGSEAVNQVSYKIKGYGTPKINFPFVSVPLIVEFNNPFTATLPIDSFHAVVSYQQGTAYVQAGTISKESIELAPGTNTVIIDTVVSLQAITKNIFETLRTVLKNKFISLRTDSTVAVKGIEIKNSYQSQIALPSTLGLVPAASRRVKVMPLALKGLVPAPAGQNENVKAFDADPIRDTVPLIKKVVRRTLYQTRKLADRLKGSSTYETAKNDFDFIFNYIRYKLDDNGKEQIRSPRRLVYDSCGDCDCFATFLSSLLTNQGIRHTLRVAAYNGSDWSHIYVIVPYQNTYITLDPVANEFDFEVKPISQVKDFPV